MRPAALCFVAALAAIPVSAQRRLLATVSDRSGAPVPGVKVKLFDVGPPAPEYAMDRSSVNAEGTGSESRRSRNDMPWSETTGGSQASRKLLRELTRDRRGRFTYAPPAFVGELLVELEHEGYESTAERFPFPLGTTRKDFVMRRPNEATEGRASSEGADGPERAQAAFDRGIAAARAGKWKDARDAFSAAVKGKPDLENGWLNFAIVEFQLGDAKGALAAAEALLALRPDHPVARQMAADARARLAAPEGSPAR